MTLDDIVASEICEAITIVQPKKRKQQIINRQYYGISFCKSGKITYIHKGQQYISDQTHAIFHPKNTSYLLICNEPGDFPIINFHSPVTLSDSFIQIDLTEPAAVFYSLHKKLQTFYFQQDKKAKGLSVFYEIVSLLSDQQNRKGNAILTPAIERLYSDFGDASLSVAELARTAHISECYFRRLFKTEFGVTPRQFINKIRIDHAKTLLSENRFRITEIAAQCGFSSVYYFSKAFRMATGVSASQYLKNMTLKL